VRISARIDIRNAIIHGPLRLKYADFRKEFLFLGCEVTERADFSYSVFHHNLVLSGTTFRKGADFRAASLAYDARLKRCKFLSGSARFDDLHVNGNFLAHGVRFGEGVKACFERARFDKYAIFRSGVFGGDAMFTDVEFGSDAEFDDAQFRRDAGFDSTRIKGLAISVDRTLTETPISPASKLLVTSSSMRHASAAPSRTSASSLRTFKQTPILSTWCSDVGRLSQVRELTATHSSLLIPKMRNTPHRADFRMKPAS